MSKITLVVEFAVKPGMADAYRAVSSKMRAAVAAEEPGTTQYDWWLADDGTRAINLETFDDSDALIHHMTHVGADTTDLLAAADVVRVEVLGQLSMEGRAAIEAAATGFFGLLGGVDR